MSFQNANINVVEILNYYNCRNISEYSEEVNFSCPFPEHKRGDQRPSSYINKETLQYNCFGCHREGNLVNFVAELEDVPVRTAEQIIEGGFTEHFLQKNSLQEYLKKVTEEKEPEQDTILSRHTLALFAVDWYKAYGAWEKNKLPKRLSLLFDRGFAPSTLNNYQIGYDTKSNRITIPCYDENEFLVGFKGRATSKNQKPKYANMGDRPDRPKYYGFGPYKVGKYVWGISSAAPNAIIVEGELDAIWLRQNGFNAVAIGGSNPTKRQIQTIKNYCNSAVLLLDDDEAGKKAARKLEKSLLQSIPVKTASCLPGKDPQDMTQKELLTQISHRKTLLTIKEKNT